MKVIEKNKLDRFKSSMPYYETTIPSTKEKVSYRPMMVKEQKALGLSVQTGNVKDSVITLSNIIKDCCNNINTDNLTSFDLEWLFLQIRIKSSGETTKIGVECPHCKTFNDIELNLTEAKLVGEIKDGVIELDHGIVIRVQFPTVTTNTKIADDENIPNEETRTLSQLTRLIYSIENGDDVELAENVSHEDLMDFVDSLTEENFKKLAEYFNESPEVSLDVDFECKNCKGHVHNSISGIENFFE